MLEIEKLTRVPEAETKSFAVSNSKVSAAVFNGYVYYLCTDYLSESYLLHLILLKLHYHRLVKRIPLVEKGVCVMWLEENRLGGKKDTSRTVATVVGGGNIFHGSSWAGSSGLDRSSADYIVDSKWILASVMNAIFLKATMESIGISTRVQTTFTCQRLRNDISVEVSKYDKVSDEIVILVQHKNDASALIFPIVLPVNAQASDQLKGTSKPSFQHALCNYGVASEKGFVEGYELGPSFYHKASKRKLTEPSFLITVAVLNLSNPGNICQSNKGRKGRHIDWREMHFDSRMDMMITAISLLAQLLQFRFLDLRPACSYANNCFFGSIWSLHYGLKTKACQGERKGENILGPGNKPEGLVIMNGLILKLSFKKDSEVVSVDPGEKNPVGTGGNIAGAVAASLAAGETDPSWKKLPEESPVNRWTTDMKLDSSVWMIFGETA
ncbi:hypothetical protein SADUNF_Sadunf07G0095200 [Salix dunnii]|uniref:Uncharacterized protein n=1 Tax=Salix dunnii TaxID=1413687 RepID=A0A835K437_9ROSI|nr:hypothetical protein SADUNF_Sadunf07G0095200 [Salix dunnii]